MADKNKLKKILSGISNFDSGVKDAFESVEKEMQRVAEKIREEAEIKTVENAKKRLGELREEVKLAIESLLDAFGNLKKELGENETNLTSVLEVKLSALRTVLVESRTANVERTKVLSDEIDKLRADIKEISERKVKIPDFGLQIQKIESELGKVMLDLKEKGEEQLEKQSEEFKEKIGKVDGDIKELRKNVMTALSRGGSANRQINVNSSVMSTRYTDINFEQFGNIGWTTTNDDDLKRVNIRASILAGGGGAGTNRTVSILSVSSTLAAAASTDYVYFANVGINLTLPTAVSNSNLYTIKNDSTSSVLVSTTAGQTIDDSATALMASENESLSFVSNASIWGVV